MWMKLKMMMPDNIADAVQFILDEKGITQQELSMRMGVSRAALRKWCGRRMSLKHIVAICIALDVRADIGVELVRLAGHTFQNNKEHNLLLAMLYETKDLSVARANEIMRQEKLDPLTEGIFYPGTGKQSAADELGMDDEYGSENKKQQYATKALTKHQAGCIIITQQQATLATKRGRRCHDGEHNE